MPNVVLWGRLLAGAASVCVAPSAIAAPQASREAELEVRLQQLEVAMAALRSELADTRAAQRTMADQAAASAEAAQKAQARVAALEAKPAAPVEGFNVGGTTVRLNGFIKTVASGTRYDDGSVATGSLGKDFYLPQTIPVGGRSSKDFVAHGKQTRLWLSTATSVGTHTLKGLVEFDFQTSAGTQGSQRTTNGYNLALRRGFVTFDNLLVGQEWSNFQYVAALPESTDFVGATEGTVFVREAQVRYTKRLSPATTLSVSAENPETASITTASPALVENDQDRTPDFTARLTLTEDSGELSLAGVIRDLSADNGVASDTALGWGVSAAGKIGFGPDKRHDLRFMASYGDGIGRYLGLNFAPDAVFAGTPGSRLETVRNFAGFAALRIGWTPVLRSSIIGSYNKANYPSGIVIPGLANLRAWSAAVNLFWTLANGFDVGAEYRHGERKLASGSSGQLDRIEFAAKYTF